MNEDDDMYRLIPLIRQNKNIIYQNNKYPVDFQLVLQNSNFFYKKQVQYENIEDIELQQEPNNITNDSIRAFINSIQNEKFSINEKNIFSLHQLSIKYEVPRLTELTTKYIKKHDIYIVFDMIKYKLSLFEDEKEKHYHIEEEEEELATNFFKYVNRKEFVDLPISILYRIINKMQEKNKNMTKKQQKEFTEFLFKCLKKHKREGSVLFSNIEMKENREEIITQLFEEYSDIFDFNMINPKFLIETTQSIIKEKKQIKSEYSKSIEQNQELANKIEEEQNKNTKMKKEINQIKNKEITLSKLNEQLFKEKEELNKSNEQLFKEKEEVDQLNEQLIKENEELDKLLPPKIDFRVDQLDLTNIQINKNIEIPKEFSMRFPEDATIESTKQIICEKFKIENHILLEEKTDEILEDQFLIYKLPKHCLITIKLLPPSYIFVFNSIEYSINLKTNLTFNTVLKEPNFQSRIKLKSPYHDIEFSVWNKKKKIIIKRDSYIIDYYNKEIVFNCKELDPFYSFKYLEKEVNIRIPDNTNFKQIRKYAINEFEKLKCIQSSRIKFCNDKNQQYKNKDIINKKCLKNRKISIILLDPKYDFIFKKKIIRLRLNKKCTSSDVIEELKKQFKPAAFDCKLKLDLTHPLNDDQILFEDKLYNKTIIIEEIPLMFHFRFNDSENIISVRFNLGDSSKISFQEIYDKKCIKMHKDLINFDLLENKSNENDSNNIPPIDRFLITNENDEPKGYDDTFLSIIKNDTQKIISIKLLQPIFLFKLRSNSDIVKMEVKRGKKLRDIKNKISKVFNIGKYDLILRINDKQLNDDDNFDNFEQNKNQIFLIHLQNPLYTFKLSIDEEESQPKRFRLSPFLTMHEVKSIILPQINSNLLDIFIGDDLIKDTDELEKFDSNNMFIITMKQICLPIKLPNVYRFNNIIELLINKDDSIKRIKEQLINCLSKRAEDQEISLYLSSKELKDETKYSDLVFINNNIIECQFIFNFKCSKDSNVQFDSFKGIYNKNTTIYQYKKKCLEHINKFTGNKCRNIDRIDLKINDDMFIMCSNDELLFNIFKNKPIKEILVTVEEDELFTRVKSGDKLEKIISENLYNEMDVHEIRKSLGNDFIIKSSKCETVIYDDMPLFSIPGKIYSEDINPENETKNINIIILDSIDQSLYVKPRNKQLEIPRDASVLDLKRLIIDIFLTVDIYPSDISILIKPKQLQSKDDQFPKDYPLYNKDGYRVLCDDQDLFTIEENTVYVSKKVINKNIESIVVLFYIKDNIEHCMECPYNDETTIKDLSEKIETPDIENTKKVVLYMGRIQSESSKLKDILIEDNINFYISLIRTVPKEDMIW